MFIEKILLRNTCPIYTLYGVFDLLSANYISDSISISKFFSFHKKWNLPEMNFIESRSID